MKMIPFFSFLFFLFFLFFNTLWCGVFSHCIVILILMYLLDRSGPRTPKCTPCETGYAANSSCCTGRMRNWWSEWRRWRGQYPISQAVFSLLSFFFLLLLAFRRSSWNSGSLHEECRALHYRSSKSYLASRLDGSPPAGNQDTLFFFKCCFRSTEAIRLLTSGHLRLCCIYI